MNKRKIINKKSIQIYSIIILIISMAIFELGYCNSEMLINLLGKTGNEIIYNFSLCRIVIYIVFLTLYLIFKNKFIDSAIEVSENKYKRIFIYASTIIAILLILMFTVVCIIKPTIFRGMSIGILSVLMLNIFIIYISNNHIKNAIITLCTLGILFSIVTNFNHAIDEKRHFMTAFNISFFNFDYGKNPITDKKIEALPQISKFNTIDNLLKEKYVPQITNDVNMEDRPSLPVSEYSGVFYIPSAIGITIARFIGGSIIDIYIWGRIFNLLAYGALICIALKLIPYKKNIFTVLFLMPMIVLLAATYSIDGMCIGVMSIFIAYCLKVYKENETIGIKQILILLGLFGCILLAKSMTYMLIALLVFILPLKKTIKKNKKYIPIMIVSAVILIVAVLGLLLYIKNTKMQTDTRWPGHVDAQEQIKFLITHPVEDIKLAINHIKDTLLNYNWYSMLHYEVFFTKDAPYIMFPLFLFILYVSISEDDYNFKKKDKIIMIITFMAVFGMTSLPLYITITQVGAMYVSGYQTRYIMPILPLILMCLSNNYLTTKKTKNRDMNIAIISGIFIFIGLLQSIIV